MTSNHTEMVGRSGVGWLPEAQVSWWDRGAKLPLSFEWLVLTILLSMIPLSEVQTFEVLAITSTSLAPRLWWLTRAMG